MNRNSLYEMMSYRIAKAGHAVETGGDPKPRGEYYLACFRVSARAVRRKQAGKYIGRMSAVFGLILMTVMLALSSSAGALEEPPPSLKYFGFVGVDCGVTDPINTTRNQNYIDEVAHFSNIAHLCAFNPSDYIIDRIGSMITKNVLPIVDVSNILFTKVESKTILRSDYRTRLVTFINNNKLTRYQRYIGALYVVDEPFWNGLDFASLRTAVDFVKSMLPTPPIMFIEAYPALERLVVPQNVNLVGFDRYGIDPLSKEYTENLALLKTKISTSQRLLIVMDGQWTATSRGAVFPREEYEAIMPNYYTLATSDPAVIGMIVYSWPGGISSASQYGVRDFPSTTRQVYESIGHAISRKP